LSGSQAISRSQLVARRFPIARDLSITASDPSYQIVHRSSHKPTKVLTGQAELAAGEAAEAPPDGRCRLMPTSDGLAVTYLADMRRLLIVICHGQDLTQ